MEQQRDEVEQATEQDNADQPFIGSMFEDTYFFDRDLAYQTALAHNPVITEDGQKLEQICYYDGEPFEHAPNNLINVPARDFEQYFAINTHRIPSRIDTTLQQYNEKTMKLEQRLYGMLKSLKKLRKAS